MPTTRAREHRRSSTAQERQCEAMTTKGTRCPVRPLAGSTKCRMHAAQDDPALAAKLTQERRLGALTASRRGLPALPADFGAISFESADDCRRVLEATGRALAEGKIAPSVANAFSGLAATALRAIEQDQSRELARIRALLERRGLL